MLKNKKYRRTPGDAINPNGFPNKKGKKLANTKLN